MAGIVPVGMLADPDRQPQVVGWITLTATTNNPKA
jgi:hypothetical protein